MVNDVKINVLRRIYVNRNNYKKVYLVLVLLISVVIILNVLEILEPLKYAAYGGIWSLSLILILYHIGNLIYFKSFIETDDRFDRPN